ncbi:hypothetical protein [Actinacidiphila bryophytorum]|uniref:hypothetical protein n=1 Tax=Actinacidiphila bryophytorum TaxID=1436133 RepID=UPI002176BEE0|nr:hypothetical protein [Actinacidiphila bryophytorum]UWE12414.1 hypothetical protein NYE86_29500 [Actinacidiphila bryophytorum]
MAAGPGRPDEDAAGAAAGVSEQAAADAVRDGPAEDAAEAVGGAPAEDAADGVPGRPDQDAAGAVRGGPAEDAAGAVRGGPADAAEAVSGGPEAVRGGPEAVPGGPDEDAADGVRLRLLQEAEGLGEADLLRLALQQAVAALGGYGGLAHLRAPADGALRLAAANGLPEPLARRWDDLPAGAPTAPAAPLRTCG